MDSTVVTNVDRINTTGNVSVHDIDMSRVYVIVYSWSAVEDLNKSTIMKLSTELLANANESNDSIAIVTANAVMHYMNDYRDNVFVVDKDQILKWMNPTFLPVAYLVEATQGNVTTSDDKPNYNKI